MLMKRQIRRSVFETNSSSVHSLTMCSDDELQKWKNGEVFFWGLNKKFATNDEIMVELMKQYGEIDWDNDKEVVTLLSEEEIKTYDEFFNENNFETFEQEYTTPKGDKVIAFGYYGYD